MMNIHIFLSTCGANNLEPRKVRMIEVKARRDRRSIAICDLPARAEIAQRTDACCGAAVGRSGPACTRQGRGRIILPAVFAGDVGCDRRRPCDVPDGSSAWFRRHAGKAPLKAKMRKNKVRLFSAS